VTSLECGALAPLWYQSANKLAHSKEGFANEVSI